MGALLAVLLLVPRPALSGPERTVPTADGVFLVHWTEAGDDAPVRAGDIDGVVGGLSRVIGRFTPAMKRPIPDGGEGGDTRVDVYLHRTAGPRGNTYPEPAPDGTSAWIEIDPRAASSERLAGTAGHEAMHAIQYAATGSFRRWFGEAVATFVELTTFDGPALATEREQHWANVLGHPEIPIDRVDGVHEYDMFILVKFLLDGQADPVAGLASLWASSSQDPLRALGASPARTLYAFARANATACDGASSTIYGPAGRCREAHPIERVGIGAVPSTVDVPLPPLAAAYVNVPVEACAAVSVALSGADDVVFGEDAAAGADGRGQIEIAERGSPLVLARGPRSTGDKVRLVLDPSAADAGCAAPDGAAAMMQRAAGCSCSVTRRSASYTSWIAMILLAALVISPACRRRRGGRRGGRAR